MKMFQMSQENKVKKMSTTKMLHKFDVEYVKTDFNLNE